MLQGSFGDMGLSMAIAALGSALGTGVAGMAAIGVMKKKLQEGENAPASLLIFVCAPMSQLFYGMIFFFTIVNRNLDPEFAWYQAVMGLGVGLAMGTSAFFQGKVGARACDALGETGKGLANYIMMIGVVEAVALIVMILMMIKIPKVAEVVKVATDIVAPAVGG
jgi:V/A-type H+-transporting ATPase subunit K